MSLRRCKHRYTANGASDSEPVRPTADCDPDSGSARSIHPTAVSSPCFPPCVGGWRQVVRGCIQDHPKEIPEPVLAPIVSAEYHDYRDHYGCVPSEVRFTPGDENATAQPGAHLLGFPARVTPVQPQTYPTGGLGAVNRLFLVPGYDLVYDSKFLGTKRQSADLPGKSGC